VSGRSVLGALTGLVLVVATAAALPSTARAADAETTLAERYVPVVRLVDQEEPCRHGEAYQPTDVNLVLGDPDVALRGPWDGTNIIKVGPTGPTSRPASSTTTSTSRQGRRAAGCVYDEWSHRTNKGHGPHAYARVVTDSTYPAAPI
jgi:hypothetical protein